MHKVVITDYLAPPADIEQRELSGLAQVDCLQARKNEELRGRLKDADAIIVFHEITLPADLVNEAERCKVIVPLWRWIRRSGHSRCRRARHPRLQRARLRRRRSRRPRDCTDARLQSRHHPR